MANQFIIPFNFEPIETKQDAGGPYTVPTGRYAKLRASISVWSYLPVAEYAKISTPSTSAVLRDGFANGSYEIWLKAGESISFVTSVGAASVTNGTGAPIESALIDETYAYLQVNNGDGNEEVWRVACHSQYYFQQINATTITASGQSRINWHVEEYAVIA